MKNLFIIAVMSGDKCFLEYTVIYETENSRRNVYYAIYKQLL